MSFLVLKEHHSSELVPVRILSDPKTAQAILQPMRWRIISELITSEKCAKDLSRALGASEQVICYHLRQLEKAGLVRMEKTEKKRGATAKFYRAKRVAVAVVPKSGRTHASQEGPLSVLSESSARLLEPFISDGRFNGRIVLGSPDIHGIFRTGARCGDRAADLALFLGSLLPLTRASVVRLDTEISQSELLQNLFLVGNPRVNTVTMMLNEWLPATYELTGHDMIMSRVTGKSYTADYEGAIQVIDNPMNRNSRVVVLAGNSYAGTRAALLAFIKYTDEIARGNSFNTGVLARIVTGLDVDSDGLIDDVEFLE